LKGFRKKQIKHFCGKPNGQNNKTECALSNTFEEHRSVLLCLYEPPPAEEINLKNIFLLKYLFK
jgi:hypothetical protein